jgi:anti-sigma regulatory factor (Ser/Thr protein kinase)
MVAARADDVPSHHALIYRDQREYLACIDDFSQAGLAAGEPLFLALPGPRNRLVRDRLRLDWGRVAYTDMAETGRNPARIIPEISTFAGRHPGRRVRCIQEPAWPGRSAAELREVIRHEALINQAFAGMAIDVLCLFDARLRHSVTEGAGHTHPAIHSGGRLRASASYGGPASIPPECDLPLPAVPAQAESVSYRNDLAPLRRLVDSHARRSGLSADRAASLVLAASELAANTLRHTSAAGTLHIWHTWLEVLCQVHDQGRITDPLAGRRRRPAIERGHGLWVVNHVCDLVEQRTGPDGTTIRLHMGLPLAQTARVTAVR